ncbi:MAG TPA: methyltransferase domain-containing protein [Pyrinomonadaceae bacterium]|jgi:hypothetical protein
MSTDNRIKNNDVIKPEKHQEYDLSRLKWIDPCSNERFIRKEPVITRDAPNENVLRNIINLIDIIFDDLSVLEQFPQTTSRGAKADPHKKLDLPNIRKSLINVEKELWDVYSALKDKRQLFVEQQIKSLGIDEKSKGLKVHIGAADHILKDWINIDAGGADLAMNVNWGLPLPDESAAYLYCAHLVEHLRYSDQAPVFLREVYRILAKGGTVRFVVPDIRKLLIAYAEKDQEFFDSRHKFYPLSQGFMSDGIATLDYILLFCGAGPQMLNFNHKFGYDSTTLSNLLLSAGFRETKECKFQESMHSELQVDDFGYNASTKNNDQHFSLFIEAVK